MQNPLIEEANAKVSIYLVCAMIGMDLPEGREGSSVKTYCPFGAFFHSDGGREPSFRAYSETNSAYCFSCKKFFTPVGLYSSYKDRSPKNSAEALLEKIGYKRPSPQDLWNEVQPKDPEPDTTMLSMALKIYCERINKSWSSDQFSGDIAEMLDRCLSLLDKVKTREQADYWLTSSKEVMSRVIAARG